MSRYDFVLFMCIVSTVSLLMYIMATPSLAQTFDGAEYKVYTVEGIGEFYVDDNPDAVKKHVRAGEVWEPHVVAAMQKFIKPRCVVIDVGAHMGVHTVVMARLAYNGMVLAFEPQSKIYSELLRNIHLNGVNNVLPMRYAITDRNHLLTMAPTPEKDGMAHIGVGGEDVVGRMLDSFAVRGVCLIKIDVEGFMPDVLVGAEGIMWRERPVLVYEAHNPEEKAEVENAMQYYNYSIFHLAKRDYVALPQGYNSEESQK